MGWKFSALELLQQPRLRKEQRVEPLLSFTIFNGRRLTLRHAKLSVFDLIRD